MPDRFIMRHATSIDDRCDTEVQSADLRVTDNLIKHSFTCEFVNVWWLSMGIACTIMQLCIFLFRFFRSALVIAGLGIWERGWLFPKLNVTLILTLTIGGVTGYKTTSDGQEPRGVSVSASMLHSAVISWSIQGALIHSYNRLQIHNWVQTMSVS